MGLIRKNTNFLFRFEVFVFTCPPSDSTNAQFRPAGRPGRAHSTLDTIFRRIASSVLQSAPPKAQFAGIRR